jgi:hypothetical protein
MPAGRAGSLISLENDARSAVGAADDLLRTLMAQRYALMPKDRSAIT